MNRGFAITFLFLFVLLSASTALADVGPCAVFPSDNIWNREIFYDPVHPQSTTFINNILATGGDYLHPDFGETPTYGIPWITVTNSQPLVPILYYDNDDGDDDYSYPEESDPGPFPIPTNAPVEGETGQQCTHGGDCHVIVINTDTCILYELYHAHYTGDANDSWEVSSSAIFDLNSNALRPAGWTSADAAGLPIFPGLVRCEEVMAGEINHAIRFTINRPYNGFYVYPARHVSGGNDNPNFPAYGARMRLKADYDLSGFTGQALVIATAMKRYGMILADIGSNWYFQGDADSDCWNDDDLNQLKDIHGSSFEFVAYPATTAAAPRAMHFTTDTPTLSWTPITWAVEYEVQIDNNSNFNSLDHALFSNTTSVMTLPLEDGRYYFRIRARRADNTWGNFSATETFTVDA